MAHFAFVLLVIYTAIFIFLFRFGLIVVFPFLVIALLLLLSLLLLQLLLSVKFLFQPCYLCIERSLLLRCDVGFIDDRAGEASVLEMA